MTQSEVVIFKTDVSAAPHHLQHLPERDPKKINSPPQFRPPIRTSTQIPERYPAKLWVNRWLEHAGKCGKRAERDSSCNLSTSGKHVAAARWVWCRVFPRGVPMIPTLCKVHSATFEALNTLQKRDTLKYRSTDTFNILVMKPLVGSSVVQGRGCKKKMPGLIPVLCLSLLSFSPCACRGFSGYSRVTAGICSRSSCNLDYE